VNLLKKLHGGHCPRAAASPCPGHAPGLCLPERRGHRPRHPQENLPQVFNPFFSTRDKGSGLGLP
jgi:hypothetical protein